MKTSYLRIKVKVMNKTYEVMNLVLFTIFEQLTGSKLELIRKNFVCF